jgi:hypothetical protein
MHPDNEQARNSRIADADQKIPREYEVIFFLKVLGN